MRTAVAAVLGFLATVATANAQPVRLSTDLFGARVAIEVRDLPRAHADQLIRETFAMLKAIERLLDPTGSTDNGLARANATAGSGPQLTEPDLFHALGRGLLFCAWSEGAHGPLGAELYELWGRDRPVPGPPGGAALQEAIAAADCGQITMNPETQAVGLARNARIDLWGFRRGHAVDRAVEFLQQGGAVNGWVEVGQVMRGFGPGPAGEGWRVTLPLFSANSEPLEPIWLRDRAAAIAMAEDISLQVAGERLAPFVNQRSGRPPVGFLAVVTSSELAAEAQPLAVSLFVMGNREGRMRLGTLDPAPAVLWVMGSGEAPPILSTYRWSDLRR